MRIIRRWVSKSCRFDSVSENPDMGHPGVRLRGGNSVLLVQAL